jgi:hypothetical protein
VPTKRRRHAITETAAVQAALDELRDELGNDRVALGELVVLGAQAKLARLRVQREDQSIVRHRLAERVRAGELPVDQDAAEEVRRTGFSRS